VVAALLLGLGMSLKDIFQWSIVPAVLCLGLALKIHEPERVTRGPAVKISWRLHDMPSAFRRYLVIVGIFTLGNSSNMFLLLRARELGVPPAQVPLLWAAVSAVAMLFSTPLSALSDRWGRVRLLLAGYLAYGVFYLAMGLMRGNGLGLYALFAFYGLFMAATEGVEKAMVADLAHEDRRGTAFGWFNLTAGLMLLPASILFGWLYERFSSLSAFTFSGGCSIIAALLLIVWFRPGRQGKWGGGCLRNSDAGTGEGGQCV
jgi:MFS family permease